MSPNNAQPIINSYHEAPKIRIKIKSGIREHDGRLEVVYTSAYKIGNQLFWRWCKTHDYDASERSEFHLSETAEKAALNAAKHVIQRRQMNKEKTTDIIEYDYIKVS